MSSVVISGNTSGTVTLFAPDISGTTVLTLPTANGTVITTGSTFSGTGPAFSAYASASQTVTSNVPTKAALDTKEWDTGTCFNNTGSTVTLNGLSVPSYSFCPNVAGYYQVNLQLRPTVSSGNIQNAYIEIYKNAALVYRLYEAGNSTLQTSGVSESGSCLIYLNGTGDYIGLYGSTVGSGTCSFNYSGTQYTSRMQASLVRAG